MRWRLGWMTVLPISLYFLEILPLLHLLGFMNFKIMSISLKIQRKKKQLLWTQKLSDHTDSYRPSCPLKWVSPNPKKGVFHHATDCMEVSTKRAALGRFVLQPALSLRSNFCWSNRLCKVTLSAWPSSTGVFLRKNSERFIGCQKLYLQNHSKKES